MVKTEHASKPAAAYRREWDNCSLCVGSQACRWGPSQGPAGEWLLSLSQWEKLIKTFTGCLQCVYVTLTPLLLTMCPRSHYTYLEQKTLKCTKWLKGERAVTFLPSSELHITNLYYFWGDFCFICWSLVTSFMLAYCVKKMKKISLLHLICIPYLSSLESQHRIRYILLQNRANNTLPHRVNT